MAVPNFQAYMNPMLELLQDGQERRITDISDHLAQKMGLNEEDLQLTVLSSKKTVHYDRVGWCATYLKQAGLLASTKRAYYQITERGLEALKSGKTINREFLLQYEDFKNFQSRGRDDENINNHDLPQSDLKEGRTPDEILGDTYQTIRKALASDLLLQLKNASSRFFEQAVIDVLLAMGYGGSQREAAQLVGQSGDGGIDGIINEDRLGLDVVYIQAKRWGDGKVGAPEVRSFVGSLEEKKATKGVFITTSDFTEHAKDYVRAIQKRVILINGEELANLMIDFGVGVTVRQTYVIKKIDGDYFSEE